MKKLVIFLIHVLLVTSVFAKSLDFIQNGEYAIYTDTRGGSNFLRGYWLGRGENDNYVVLSRNKNMNTDQEVRILIELSDDANGLPHIDRIAGISKSTPPEFAQGIADFLNYITLYKNHVSEIGYDTVIEDPWDSYTLDFSFNKLLPFFRFLDVRQKGSDKPSYMLNCSGIANANSIDEFFKRDI